MPTTADPRIPEAPCETGAVPRSPPLGLVILLYSLGVDNTVQVANLFRDFCSPVGIDSIPPDVRGSCGPVSENS